MKRKMALLLAVIMVVSLFAGCGKNSSKTGGEAQADKFADRELVIAAPTGVATFDPTGTIANDDLVAAFQVFDFLVSYDNDGKIVPNLAEKWDVSPDGKTYTFYIKKGVKFSDGTEFKASDVKFSIDRTIASPFLGFCLANVENCKVVDDYTVDVNLKVPSVTLLSNLSLYTYMFSEQAVKKYGDQFGKTAESVIGTGPYILKEWKPSEYYTIEANPNYFKGATDIKKIKVKAITDENATIIALQTGEVGLYLKDVPGMAYKSLSNDSKLSITDFPGQYYVSVGMNCESGPFADVRLRQAVAYAVDREKTSIVGADGRATIVDYAGLPEFAGDPNIKTWYKKDIEKAKQLVKEAGMEGKTITIKASSGGSDPKIVTSLQEDLSKIGLQAKVQLMERTTLFADLSSGNSEIFVSKMGGCLFDMDSDMRLTLYSANIGSTNRSRYSNPALDEILDKAQSINDPEARKPLYTEAIKIFTNDIPQVPLYYPNGSRAYTKDLVITNKVIAKLDFFYGYRWNK